MTCRTRMQSGRVVVEDKESWDSHGADVLKFVVLEFELVLTSPQAAVFMTARSPSRSQALISNGIKSLKCIEFTLGVRTLVANRLNTKRKLELASASASVSERRAT